MLKVFSYYKFNEYKIDYTLTAPVSMYVCMCELPVLFLIVRIKIDGIRLEFKILSFTYCGRNSLIK